MLILHGWLQTLYIWTSLQSYSLLWYQGIVRDDKEIQIKYGPINRYIIYFDHGMQILHGSLLMLYLLLGDWRNIGKNI